jgi:hypothetical protein
VCFLPEIFQGKRLSTEKTSVLMFCLLQVLHTLRANTVSLA